MIVCTTSSYVKCTTDHVICFNCIMHYACLKHCYLEIRIHAFWGLSCQRPCSSSRHAYFPMRPSLQSKDFAFTLTDYSTQVINRCLYSKGHFYCWLLTWISEFNVVLIYHWPHKDKGGTALPIVIDGLANDNEKIQNK